MMYRENKKDPTRDSTRTKRTRKVKREDTAKNKKKSKMTISGKETLESAICLRTKLPKMMMKSKTMMKMPNWDTMSKRGSSSNSMPGRESENNKLS